MPLSLAIRRLALTLVVTTGITAPAGAETLGFSDAIKVLAQSCGADIGRYCKTAMLANWGIGRCLDEHQGSVSAQCTGELASVRQAVQARLDAQAAAPRICQGDAGRLCQQAVRKQGYTLRCLLSSERSVSKRCNQAITDAGWR